MNKRDKRHGADGSQMMDIWNEREGLRMVRRSLGMVVTVGLLALMIGGCATKKMKEEQETLRQEVIRVTSDVDAMKIKLEDFSKKNSELAQKVEFLAKKETELAAKLAARPAPKSPAKSSTKHKTTRHR